MPDILTIDDQESPGGGVEPPKDKRGDGVGPLRRFRDNMLDELAFQDIAELTGKKESTVKTYLSTPERRSQLAAQIRSKEALRARALDLVALKRRSSPR